MILKRELLFDTHAFLAFFGREAGSETIKKYFDAVQTGEAEGFVAAITLTELAHIHTRKTDAATARLRVMQIQGSKLQVVPLSRRSELRQACSNGREFPQPMQSSRLQPGRPTLRL